MMIPRFRCCGSAGLSFVDDAPCLNHLRHPSFRWMAPKTDLLTAPIVTRAKTLSEFNKAELLEEAYARNLWVNDRWSTVELRSAIQEDRKNPSADLTRLLRRRAPCIVTQHLLDCTIVCYTILSYSTIEKTL